jgi:hypothetical protein
VTDSRFVQDGVNKSMMKGKLEDLGVGGSIILECILKQNGRDLFEFIFVSIWTNDWSFWIQK